MGASFKGARVGGGQPPSYAPGYQSVDITALPLISNLLQKALACKLFIIMCAYKSVMSAYKA